MQQLHIKDSDSGQTLIKFLDRYFKEATQSFLYKMIRKKNITLNGKKAQGNEKLFHGDYIDVFMADETIDKFRGTERITDEYEKAYQKYKEPEIIFENEHILLINKPVGMLSQKSKADDLSANEWIIGYLKANGRLQLKEFVPSVCNRLDRNTGGILIFGKTVLGCNTMNQMLRERTMKKFYKTIVIGHVMEEKSINGYLYKDEIHNKVIISQSKQKEEYTAIETRYIPIRYNEQRNITELDVELITGKSHQIRAHLSSIGFPIIGDEKYGNRKKNSDYKSKYKLNHQLLYSYKLVFPNMEHPLEDISCKTFTMKLPDIVNKIITDHN